MKSRVIQDDSDARATNGQVVAGPGSDASIVEAPSTPCGASQSMLRAAPSPR